MHNTEEQGQSSGVAVLNGQVWGGLMKDRNVAMNVVKMKGKSLHEPEANIFCRTMPVVGCLGVHDAGKQSYAEHVGEQFHVLAQ
jgi:hypothetical protein